MRSRLWQTIFPITQRNYRIREVRSEEWGVKHRVLSTRVKRVELSMNRSLQGAEEQRSRGAEEQRSRGVEVIFFSSENKVSLKTTVDKVVQWFTILCLPPP
jgi:hypothetical protein